VHPHCLDAIDLARRLGYETIALTTNGLLIKDLPRWIDAGLTSLNVSLDALDAERFFAVTKSREVDKVRRLVEDAARQRLSVKVNTVLLRSKNGQRENIEALIDWATGLPITLRFIELMETKLNGSFSSAERVLGTEIEPLLTVRGLAQVDQAGLRPDLRGPATDYAAPDRPGRIGLINPMSCNFCSKCNRLRVTAQGRLKLCLFGDNDIPLDLASPEAVALNVRRLIDRKPERHYLEDGNVGNVATFRTIGG
jgi:cyclic pyranopterin phosphate synthase